MRCDEADLDRVFAGHDAEKSGLKLCCMADAGGKSDWKHQIVPRSESVLDMIRVAFYAHQVSEAVEMIEHCHELGYETTANLMAVTNVEEVEIDTVLDGDRADARRHDGDRRQLRPSVPRAGRPALQEIHRGHGRHGQRHRHARAQQPAAGVRQHDRGDHPGREPGRRDDGRTGPRGGQLPHGAATWASCAIRSSGCGRWSSCLQNHIEPLKATTNWGPSVPYNITGQMNLHPRAAIQFLASPRTRQLRQVLRPGGDRRVS